MAYEKFKFGKYKGQLVKDVVKTEKGIGYCRWYLEQPINPDFKEPEEKFREHIRACLGNPETVPPKQPSHFKEAKPVEEPHKEPNLHSVMQVKLDACLDLLREIADNTTPKEEPKEITFGKEDSIAQPGEWPDE